MSKADIIVGLQYGDEGKGKVTHALLSKNNYTHVLRYNGGCNAGHTIYHNGIKFVTHHIPSGVFYGVKSIIGSGCVVDINKFKEEIEYLENNGIKTEGLIFIAENAHMITLSHKEEDSKDKAIGTTRSGNGPAYRDKYNRTGLRFEEFVKTFPEYEKYKIDLYKEFHENEVHVLCEGAQGFGLDIDWGEYPYVTSSSCTTAGALLNGIPASWVNEVWGIAKAYSTYVGAKEYQDKNDPKLEEFQKVGNEFGATTGRKRQCDYLDIDFLVKSAKINGVTHICMNKMDIVRECSWWSFYKDRKLIHFDNETFFKCAIESYLPNVKFFFSEHPDRI